MSILFHFHISAQFCKVVSAQNGRWIFASISIPYTLLPHNCIFLPWPQTYMTFLETLLNQVEKFMVHNANRVAVCRKWPLLAPSTQRRIKDAALVVVEFSRPTGPRPKLSSANRVIFYFVFFPCTLQTTFSKRNLLTAGISFQLINTAALYLYVYLYILQYNFCAVTSYAPISPLPVYSCPPDIHNFVTYIPGLV